MSNHKRFPRFARCINYCANLRTNFLNNERIIDRRRQKYEKLKITSTLFQNYYQSENLKAKHSVSLLCKSQIAVWFTVTNFRTNALKILKSVPIAKLKRKCLIRYLNLTLLINSVNYVTTKWHKIPISFLYISPKACLVDKHLLTIKRSLFLSWFTGFKTQFFGFSLFHLRTTHPFYYLLWGLSALVFHNNNKLRNFEHFTLTNRQNKPS